MVKYIFKKQAEEIIEIFEDDYPLISSIRDYEDWLEVLNLYTSAKKYLERYG